jgi:hypothetical protein
MTQYLLAIHHPDDYDPSAEEARLPSPVGCRSRCARFTDGGPNGRRVTQAFDLAGITNTVGCPVLRVLGEGRVPRPQTQRVLCRTDKVASSASIPALAKNARTGHPRAQLPAAIRSHQ